MRLNIPKTLISSSLAILIGLTFWGFSACNRPGKEKPDQPKETQQKTFILPEMPQALTAPKDRANYLVAHYWDHIEFNDTTYIYRPDITEQAFVNFVQILPIADYKKTTRALQNMLAKAEEEKTGRMYQHFLSLSEKYFYDPNSPFRNEEYYIPVATYILQDKKSSETERVRPTHRLEMMQKNRTGKKATNFTYTLHNGETGTLYGLKKDYTLLYFSNPDCQNCKEVTHSLHASIPVNDMLEKGLLDILVVYPDEDLEAWRKHYQEIPKHWINAYDKHAKIIAGKSYDLKAIPTLYLLDAQKRVVLKDVDFAQLEEWLRAHFENLSKG